MWQKGMKTRDRNTELDWSSLQGQVDQAAVEAKARIMPSELGKGPYRVWAHHVSGNPDRVFEIKSKEWPTFDAVMKGTVSGRLLDEYWYSIHLQDGTEVAHLAGNTWTLFVEPEVEEAGEANDASPAPDWAQALQEAYQKAIAVTDLDTPRWERALDLAQTRGAVERNGGQFNYTVRSISNGNYSVWKDGRGWECECKDFEFGRERNRPCKHIRAVWLTIRVEQAMEGQEQDPAPFLNLKMCMFCDALFQQECNDQELCPRCERENALPALRKVKIGADGKRSKMWK